MAAAEPATSKPMLSSAERQQRFHQRIVDYQSSKDTSPLLICVFGDSVTQDWMKNEKLDPANVYHALVAYCLVREEASSSRAIHFTARVRPFCWRETPGIGSKKAAFGIL
ncbi:MAG: hypothetical protein EHM17_05865 [Verrucomicrobiaceae bacterium]|nr:MAG: hypothetical protein EHM17_05865 [Verrucomicrobiaceae bacterium]